MYKFRLRPRLFEYEKKFAKSELKILFGNKEEIISVQNNYFEVDSEYCIPKKILQKLTYFKEVVLPSGERLIPDIISWELSTYNNKRYSTRYSSHGIHEYKGKFNPQTVHSLINQFLNFETEDVKIYDPYAGSGTNLLEASLLGIDAFGTDVNPMAVLISKAKQDSMVCDLDKFNDVWDTCIAKANKEWKQIELGASEREVYLQKWFPIDTLKKIETLKLQIEKEEEFRDILMVVISNILREYSYQEPGDLRIRRRKEIPDQIDIFDRISEDVNKYIERLKRFKNVYKGKFKKNSQIYFSNIEYKSQQKFDIAITSPPYATALPYIDTQRLSIVWTKRGKPSEIKELDASLTGSREVTKLKLDKLRAEMIKNRANLPKKTISLVSNLESSLDLKNDGFRRKATPPLMYQYFKEMKKMFQNLKTNIKDGGYYLLVVGKNKTTLGGIEFVIDTPGLLGEVAESVGWQFIGVEELQTYKRYGINSKNAVNAEGLVVLKKI